jgi:hypothetical protein
VIETRAPPTAINSATLKETEQMNRKQSIKKTAAKDKATEELDALAHHISETLRIMGASESIPARVYNEFADALNNLYNLVNDDELVHSEQHIRLYLARLMQTRGVK